VHEQPKALNFLTNARQQLLTDAQVRSIIAAAREVDDEGDFGRLVLLAAATGARFSQLAALKVGSVQPTQNRILVPAAHKGRVLRPKPAVAVPVSPGVIDELAPIMSGRAPGEPLLEHWLYHQPRPYRSWHKHKRVAWALSSEVARPWRKTMALADAPAGTIMYALRHTSIVRGLRAGLPVRLVAALHDTSSEMIEAHYSAYIVDATEELSRRNVLAL
jgi:integrase